MAREQKVPENISEEYYQISTEILSSFPKYRPPVDLFRFNEGVAQLIPYIRKGQRLTNEQVEEAQTLCADGNLFVSRADHPIYSRHILKQLDLVLVDANMKDGEITDILQKALGMRLNDFFQQPVRPVFDLLYRDTMVFTEYIWTDRFRIKQFMRRLFRTYSLERHSLNTLSVGLWLLSNTTSDDSWKRRLLDRATISLLLHDVGMAKVPSFITGKGTPLKPEEKEKIPAHPLAGIKIMHKLELIFDEMRSAILEHHERLDGSGYPQHQRDISSFGRLVAVADSFSAMIAKRPYAPAKEPVAAANELASDSRYDKTYTVPLRNALLTNAFGPFIEPRADFSAPPESGEKEE